MSTISFPEIRGYCKCLYQVSEETTAGLLVPLLAFEQQTHKRHGTRSRVPSASLPVRWHVPYETPNLPPISEMVFVEYITNFFSPHFNLCKL